MASVIELTEVIAAVGQVEHVVLPDYDAKNTAGPTGDDLLEIPG